jgi:hypothetical protein
MVRGSPLFWNPFSLVFVLNVPSGTWLGLLLVQHTLTIQDSRLCRLRSNAFSLTNHVPLDEGIHLITTKPTGFYSKVKT